MKTKWFLIGALLIIFLAMTSCEYEFIETDTSDPSVTVKFSTEIIPIFNANNNCTACHKAGSQPPDLTTDRAYNSIVPSLVKLANPETSKIYTYPNPASSGHGFKKYTPAQASLVLNWIKQGAQNN